jgi:hypothetical protein
LDFSEGEGTARIIAPATYARFRRLRTRIVFATLLKLYLLAAVRPEREEIIVRH